MQDLIKRPIEGFTQGPLESGMGVIIGTTSLVSHSAFGVKNVVGTISSLLSKVTMNKTYQQQREIQNQKQARNVGSGIQEGSEFFVKGVADGIAGFFSKLFQGVQQDGASGFLKGLWQGTLGLIIKPPTIFLDAVSKTSEGVKNELLSYEQPNNNRIRYMRPFYQSDGDYKEYNQIEAECYEVIKGIKKGNYENHRLLRVDAIRYNEHFGLILTETTFQTLVYFWKFYIIEKQEIQKSILTNSITQLAMTLRNQSQKIIEEI